MGCLEKEDLTEGEDDEPPLVAWEAKEFLAPTPPPTPPASDHLPVADIIEAVTVWARAAPAPVGNPMDRGLSFGGGDTGASSSLSLQLATPPLVEPPATTRTARSGWLFYDKADKGRYIRSEVGLIGGAGR